jgi:flagellin
MQRMRELAVQGANGTNTTADSASLDLEFQALSAEVTRIAGATQFNGQSVLGANAAGTSIQVGANSTQKIVIPETDLTAVMTTFGTTNALTDTTKSTAAIVALDTALGSTNTLRATLGAAQNQMGYAVSNLQISVENQSASKSRIMDTDFAAETANLSRSQILQQAGTAMVAQANQLPQGVLALLK